MKKLAFACLLVVAAAVRAEDIENDIITVWPKDHGTFVFVNAQNAVPAESIKEPIASLAVNTGYEITLRDGVAPELKDVPAELARLGAKGAIWIVDNPAYPLTLGACEDGWGFVNVSKAMLDRPNAEVLSKRLTKLMLRLFGNVNGAGATTECPHCALESAFGIVEIDALNCAELSPFALMKIGNHLEKIGYKAVLMGTYQEACEGGWAPAPTNDVQKAVWDKVHQLPSKPIKIVPESRRVKK